MGGTVSADARAESVCPNQELRTGLSASLPDCRAYELVTPPYKQGSPANLIAVSPDGQHAIVQSVGNFGDAKGSPENEGATYELTRTETGWDEAGIDLEQGRFPFEQFYQASETLDKSLWRARQGSQPIGVVGLYIREADGHVQYLGPTTNPEGTSKGLPGLGGPPGFASPTYVQGSRDLSHVFFARGSEESVEKEELEPSLWRGDTTAPGGHPSLYEYTAAGAEGAEPRLVGVKNEGPLDGSPHLNEGAELVSECGINLGSREGNAGDGENAVSESGGTIFFTAIGAGCGATAPPVNELDARVGGEKTLKISSPLHPLAQGDGSEPEECDSVCEAAAPEAGLFQGASRDGSKVFFLTKQPLLNGDEGGTGAGQDLYEAHIEGQGRAAKLARLIQVSYDPVAGQAAEVQGVTRVSEDGSHIYFVARGVLANNSNGQSMPFSTARDGADNLYVYEPDPANLGKDKTAFVAMLCSEAGLSGSVSDSECRTSDAQMWNAEGNAPAQATPDGRFLVFSTATDLTAPEDTSTVSQVFRYDAETGALLRVSIGQRGAYECPATKANEEGFNCNGNTDTFAVVSIGSPTIGRPVAISEDGSYVVFQSADGLTPGALNAQAESIEGENFGTVQKETYFANNVYEYHDGEVSLISDGQDTSATNRESSVRVDGMTSSGADVFFMTADRLVPQDTDTQQDIYDARVGGGFPLPPVPTPCQEACQGSPSAAPLFGVPSSSTFSGTGNLTPPVSKPPVKPKPVKCKRGFVKKQNKCVKKNKLKKGKKSNRRASR
ncbi:MAG TPA: hypothetical protein VGX26_10335 [Solirubrobacteraceae bacterium]|nr:hypothetical protein [Solirubrobacteraceae bacterium]